MDGCAIGDGWMVPAGYETGAAAAHGAVLDVARRTGRRPSRRHRRRPYDLTHEVMQANAWLAARDDEPAVAVRQVSGPDAPLTVLARVPRTWPSAPPASPR
jgi:starch synthase (maltosyl-transferring)